MRITIKADGVPTEAVRELAAALSTVQLRSSLKVGCDGPELWNVETPPMLPYQWARVACTLVKFEGGTAAEALDALREGAK